MSFQYPYGYLQNGSEWSIVKGYKVTRHTHTCVSKRLVKLPRNVCRIVKYGFEVVHRELVL